MKRLFLIAFLLLSLHKLSASHIIGGEIYYDYLGGGNYKITLKVYRDCINGQYGFDGLINPADGLITDPTLTVFDGNGNYLSQILLPPPTVTLIPSSINNSCITAPDDVCIEEGVYTKTVSLPPQPGGYYIVYQRCCRSGTTLNLVNPGTTGATYYAHIPGTELTSVNSSPRFLTLPPVFVCNGFPIGFNHAANDPDGDSLVYSLAAPFEGLSNCCGNVPMGGASPTTTPCAPTCPPFNNPPYPALNFIAPYSGSYPLSSSPAININPTTGLLNGSPDLNGQWAVGICVKEYRNGILIGTHYRDYMFSVVNCIIQVASIIKPQPQALFCNGNTISFVNQSIGGTVYHWDFGVNTLTNDTSNLVNPTYTYADTGRYEVTLITNPGKPCEDTTKEFFYVYPPLNPTFVAPAAQCLKNNSFSFSVGGSFANYSTFNWNFGSSATPSNSTLQNPSGISFSAPGTFPVTLIVNQAVCADTLTNNIVVNQNNSVNFDSTALNLCDHAITTLTNINPGTSPASYSWEFSDGTILAGAQPTHAFSPLGVYDVTVTIITLAGCIDTTRFTVAPFITVNPGPLAGFSFSPTLTTIFDPDINFYDESTGATTWDYNFGDGNSSNLSFPTNHYATYGDFNVTQIVSNNFNCKDTVTKTVKILPEFRFWVPNCFTPRNKDGLNDLFMPVVVGVSEYEFSIFNRWGEMIFKTTDSKEGWDGKYKNLDCSQGEYSWVVTFKNDETSLMEQHYGSFLLLK